MTDIQLQELNDSLIERMKDLENRKQTLITGGRISELQLVIIKVQGMILDSIKKENANLKSHN